MRAFLSRRDERDERTADAGRFGDLGVAWLAGREARAILAETEPAEFHPFQPVTRSDMSLAFVTRDYRGYAVAVDCLAEALAAFVEG